MKTFPIAKHTSRTLGLLAVAGILVAGLAACNGAEGGVPEAEGAQALASQSADEVGDSQGEGAHGGRGHRGAKDPAAFIKRFDANGDGKIAVAELPEKMRERMGAADTDKDGFVSKEEMKAKAEQHGKERFAKKDANGDGALTESEVGEEFWAHMKVADSNGDAQITLAELQEARASGKLHGMRHGHGEERRGDERRGGPEE